MTRCRARMGVERVEYDLADHVGRQGLQIGVGGSAQLWARVHAGSHREVKFAIMTALMQARTAASLSQTEIARRMNTTQSVVARLERRGHRASLTTLRSYAEATGHRLRITLEPLSKPPRRV